VTRIRRSVALARASWGVLRQEPGLAVLPVLSAVVSLAVVGAVGVAVWLTLGRDTGADGTATATANVATWLLVAVGYVAVAFVQTAFLAALCIGANERLSGRDTDLREALARVRPHLHRILGWAVVAATVSFVLQAVEARFEALGRVLARLLGAAWAVVTFLVVPVIVFEDAGPGRALRRSGSLLAATWGENLTAQVGFGILGFLAALPALVLGTVGAASGIVAIAVVAVAVAVVWLVVVAAVLAALSGIYRSALYRYAVDGQVPAAFGDVDLAHAFGPTRRTGPGPSPTLWS